MDADGTDSAKDGASEADPLLAAIGRRVTQAREAAGLSVLEAARAGGVTKAYQWRVEQGRQNLNVRSLARVALALSTTMSNLLDGVAADPDTASPRPYAWKSGADPREKKPGGGWLPAKKKSRPSKGAKVAEAESTLQPASKPARRNPGINE